MKSGPETTLLNHYTDRLSKSGRSLGITHVDIVALPESRAAPVDLRKTDEAKALFEKFDSGGHLIALDEHGKDIDSVQFSNSVQSCLDSGVSTLAIAIGGPDGHGPELLKKANATVRFGKMTWPHQLVRVLAAEQLYRATTILSGHPYHRQ